jgi:hypothetical protein
MISIKNDNDKTLNGHSESNSVGSPNSKNNRSVVIMKNKKTISDTRRKESQKEFALDQTNGDINESLDLGSPAKHEHGPLDSFDS